MFGAIFAPLKWLLPVFLTIWSIVLSGGETVEFTILATADLHGCMAQLQNAVAPAVAQYHKSGPQSVIYVDIGDTAQGAYPVNRRRGAGVLPQLAAAGCKLWVPGNHEMEYGFEAFKRMVNEFSGTVLAANLHAPELTGKVKPYVIVELNQVKVAFIGLMLQNMNNCFPVAEERFQTLPGRAALRKSINEARSDGAGVIVLLRHAGKYGSGENLPELLKNMPEVDLVIGAHTHQSEPGCRIGRVWYVQPPSHGRGLLTVKVKYDLSKRQIRQIESGIEVLDVYKESHIAQEFESVKPCRTADEPAQRMRAFTQADLALYAANRSSMERLLSLENPRLIDYYNAFPYFDPVITVKVTDRELHEIMREYLKFAHKRKQLLLTAGFSYRARRGKLHGLIMEKEQDVYVLAISAYAAAGAGGQLPDTRRILINKINHKQAENAPGILRVITGKD
ncbi:MAG: bifunctional metallophosphatase/5'-nucleotidase [Lentisphaerae bacterium]|nr:bifunctional metallophosphatase/5'-nucleotidase [Lentisphaerota bacterium]